MEKFDYIIIGSGFGGSVSAMRLAQKGYRVAILEEGKRFKDGDYTSSRKSIKDVLWNPKLGFFGIFKFWPLKNVVILGGSGVGGGSNNYANTLYVPGDSFFKHPTIQAIGGKEGLMSYFELGKKMLGVVENEFETHIDRCFKKVVEEDLSKASYQRTPVGVFFGKKGEKQADPYFYGEGPDRTGCELCGGCMTGCNFNAKNTLEKNYLYFAEKFGAKIYPLHQVVDVDYNNDNNTTEYQVTVKILDKKEKEKEKVFHSKGIVFSAGVMGSLNLLLKLKKQKKLNNLSDKLGLEVRTNSEAFIGLRSKQKDIDLSEGVAITSSAFVDDKTHIQPIRFAKGINLIKFRIGIYTDEHGFLPRQIKFLLNFLLHPIKAIRWYNPKNYDKQTVLLMVMQSIDNDINISLKKSFFPPFNYRISSSRGSTKVPKTIPVGKKFADLLSKKLNGVLGNLIYDVILNTPFTAHILGGCNMGTDVQNGVIDYQNRVFGYDNMYVCDASVVPTNLGVNPSLTIVALAEKAMSMVPSKDGNINYLKVELKNEFQNIINENVNLLAT